MTIVTIVTAGQSRAGSFVASKGNSAAATCVLLPSDCLALTWNIFLLCQASCAASELEQPCTVSGERWRQQEGRGGLQQEWLGDDLKPLVVSQSAFA